MAEHGEIVAGATGLGALLGAFFTALKLVKPGKGPEKGDDMADVLQRVAILETRAEAAETARKEDREDFGLVFAELKKLGQSNARIEGALGIGSDGR